jgi:transglutaminase-like putative cysteine protease
MRIRVSQQMTYRYAPAAKSLIQTLRLTPRNTESQFVVNWRIDVDVDGRLRPVEDAFANLTHVLSVAGPVEQISVNVQGTVETFDSAGVVRGAVERFPESLYLRDTPLTEAGEAVQAFAEEATAAGQDDRLARMHLLMAAIHQRFDYDASESRTALSAADTLSRGAGACQDFAHLFIAAARHLSVPARYVSGFVWRGEPGSKERGGADAGHAWAEVYIAGLGWVAFDPANKICPAGAHVRVAAGLDQLGAAPVRGAQYGGGEERMEVRVAVDALEQSQSQSQS